METCNTEELYLLHRERLLSLIQAKVDDAQKAEDLLHDSFLKLQTCCNNDCECEKPKSYLFRMALNTVFDFFKKRKKEANSTGTLDYIENDESNLDTSAFCDLVECIHQFLRETSPENQIAFSRVDLQNISQVTVAAELNIPLPTLKSRVQRTRKFLNQKISTCCPNFKENCK